MSVVVFHVSRRRDALRKKISDLGLDAYLIEDSLNLFYLTGHHFSAGQLLVSRSGDHLLVDGRYQEAAQKIQGLPTQLIEKGLFQRLFEKEGWRRLGIPAEGTTIERGKQLQKELSSLGVEILPGANCVAELRRIKDTEEVACLREAGRLTLEGIRYVEKLFTSGVREQDLALELEIYWRRQGGERLAFDPIIAFGTNSSMPHYRAGLSSLEAGMAVLVDVGVVVEGYHGDATRFFHREHVLPPLRIAEQAVYEAQQAAINAVAPGVKLGDLDAIARRILEKHGLGAYFTHSLGHGIGLEIHENPRLKEGGVDGDLLCQPGMVFTIEPGVYLPGIGGVRLEEMIHVTSTGYEVLTEAS